MQVLSVLQRNSTNSINFGRAPKPTEEQGLFEANDAAKKYLGIKNQALIIHGSSFPGGELDLFIGSPISKEAVEFNKFAKLHGYDSIQEGPPGLISPFNPSPYSGSVFSKNYLFADMSKLTNLNYGEILTIKDIKDKASNVDYDSTKTDFQKAFEVYDELFEKSYDNLQLKKSSKANALNLDFAQYKQKADKWLKTDALFNILQKKYGTNDIDKWPSDLDRNLMAFIEDKKHPQHQEAVQRYKNLLTDEKNVKEIDVYKFKQFIIDRQEKEFIKEHPERLHSISDAVIGFSYQDLWANPDAFLKDYRVGCPYGGRGYAAWDSVRGCNQDWDIPALDPKKLFNADGTLGKAGLLIKQKFERILETHGNLRIDHVLGLIDPWIYNKNNVEKRFNEAGEVVYTNLNGANVSHFGRKDLFYIEDNWPEDKKNIFRSINEHIASLPQIDPEHNYSQVLEKIVLPVLKEKGLDPKDAVWETLCTDTDEFRKVYYNKLHLPEISDLRDRQGEFQPKENYFLISSHDTPPFATCASNEFYENRKYNGGSYQPDYLIGRLHPDKSNEEKQRIIDSLAWDRRVRVKAKYEELFLTEKFEVAFTDQFGLTKPYNTFGTKDNWTLRLPKNWKKEYYETLAKKDWQKIALNIPELYKRAVTVKAIQNNEFEKMKPLIDKLAYYQKMLYEPEIISNVKATISAGGLVKNAKKIALKALKVK